MLPPHSPLVDDSPEYGLQGYQLHIDMHGGGIFYLCSTFRNLFSRKGETKLPWFFLKLVGCREETIGFCSVTLSVSFACICWAWFCLSSSLTCTGTLPSAFLMIVPACYPKPLFFPQESVGHRVSVTALYRETEEKPVFLTSAMFAICQTCQNRAGETQALKACLLVFCLLPFLLKPFLSPVCHSLLVFQLCLLSSLFTLLTHLLTLPPVVS